MSKTLLPIIEEYPVVFTQEKTTPEKAGQNQIINVKSRFDIPDAEPGTGPDVEVESLENKTTSIGQIIIKNSVDKDINSCDEEDEEDEEDEYEDVDEIQKYDDALEYIVNETDEEEKKLEEEEEEESETEEYKESEKISAEAEKERDDDEEEDEEYEEGEDKQDKEETENEEFIVLNMEEEEDEYEEEEEEKHYKYKLLTIEKKKEHTEEEEESGEAPIQYCIRIPRHPSRNSASYVPCFIVSLLLLLLALFLSLNYV